MRKTLCVILMLLLSFALIYAQSAPNGSGTENDPYQIASLENLVWVAQTDSIWDDGAYFIQTADIDAAATDTMTIGGFNPGWSPIGNSITPFHGSYDGDGHVIDNLVTHGYTANMGLFGVVDGLEVKNLGLTNIQMTVGENGGALVGHADSSITVTNCYATGSLESNSNYAGGLIGFIKNARFTITDSHTDVDVLNVGTGDGVMAGGFLGYIELTGNNDYGGTIEDCYSTGDVALTDQVGGHGYAGGFIARVHGDADHTKWSEIKRCYSTGNVTGAIGLHAYGPAGGFIGNLDWRYKVSECYSTGNVINMAKDTGGFIGYVKYETHVENCYSLGNVTRVEGSDQPNYGGFVGFQNPWHEYFSTIKNCYSIGSVSGTDDNNNGFLGNKGAACIDTLNFWDVEFSGQDSSAGNAVGKTTAEMKTASTFTDAGWDFTNIWEVNDNYPNLKNNSNAELVSGAASRPKGSGTETDPYQIASLENLVWVAQTDSIWDDGAYFIQTADIDAAATDTMTIGGFNPGWSPIGNSITPFHGSYDGDGHVIDNLVTHGYTANMGLFGVVDGLEVKNLGLTNIQMTVGENGGALVGHADSSITVTNCYATGSLESNSNYAGGLIGFIKNARFTITDSHTDVDVLNVGTGDGVMAGGFLGYIELTGNNDYGGTIEDCYSTGDVALTDQVGGHGYAGGFIARVHGDADHTKWSEIKRCYSTGNVTGAIGLHAYGPAGGFIGNLDWRYKVSECYSTGNVINMAKDTGGFIGYVKYETHVENCYSLGNVTRVEGSDQPNYGGFVGFQNPWHEYFSTIKNCYSIGSVSGTDDNNNGFLGNKGAACIDTLNFWDVEFSGQDSSAGNAVGKTTAEMKTASTFTDAGWDFTNVWEIVGDNYPTLRALPVTAVDDEEPNNIPVQYSLEQNYPNPFNPTTTIRFGLPTSGNVTLIVYNILGQKVATIVNARLNAGTYQYQFNAGHLSSGIYLYKLQTKDYLQIKKMMLIK